jgi:hypothetical protein
MIAVVLAPEIPLHLLQFLLAVAFQRLDAFVGGADCLLLAHPRIVMLVLDQRLRDTGYLVPELTEMAAAEVILDDDIVDESDGFGFPYAERQAAFGQFEGFSLAHPLGQGVGPIFGAVQARPYPCNGD